MSKIHFQQSLRPLPLPKKTQLAQKQQLSFTDVLQQAQQSSKHTACLKISKHASQRLAERGIEISQIDWQRITDKVKEAKSKGVQEPLVIMNKAALIVSAKNETVITAIDLSEVTDQIFTNIDGTIILK